MHTDPLESIDIWIIRATRILQIEFRDCNFQESISYIFVILRIRFSRRISDPK